MSTDQKSTKRPYQPPKLIRYGNVGQLTMNMTSGINSEASGMPRDNSSSDPALKTNVVRIGDHPAGFGIYLFDYKPEFSAHGEGRQFGVMADEVEQVFPRAVSRDADGFRRVDYGLLGIRRG